ncbi:MAG: hypothetical protein HYV97_01105 [Bdellovibrio sp.]|nr:hypothetical protein [Bdellovibrio sp.]
MITAKAGVTAATSQIKEVCTCDQRQGGLKTFIEEHKVSKEEVAEIERLVEELMGEYWRAQIAGTFNAFTR